jgi:crotonobetainyl-CoA:carnitine CoA-transferase CaiB-like acyl-CoA transferase
MSGPLEGIKVVELGVWVAGPAAAGVLGDWGADVIKIEPLAGDPARSFQFILGRGMPNNPVFELDNRNKRSIALDVSTVQGRNIALDLVGGADVFVTNVRPEGLKRAGLDEESLRSRWPGLIYGQITGYGLEGPDANRPGFDIAAYWARSGIAHLLTPSGAELPILRGGMGDHSTGVTFAGAICAALLHRERTGQGQLVSTSLLRQGVYTIGFDLNMALSWGRYQPVANRDSVLSPSVNNYRTADEKWFWIVGIEGDRHWPPLARVVGHPEWIDDPRFASARERAINHEQLTPLLDEIFATRTLSQWAQVFATEPDMFWAPVNSPEEILSDPQLAHSGGLIEVPDAHGSTTTMINSPADFHGSPGVPRALAPALGEHTRNILRETGRSEAEIEDLLLSRVVAETVT